MTKPLSLYIISTPADPEPILKRHVTAIRHVHFEDLGVWERVLRNRGYEIRYLDAGVDATHPSAVTDADLLIVLGGPVGVGDLDSYPFVADEIHTIESRIAHGRPVLGVCLGAQLIASALGARITPVGAVEIGFGPLNLTEPGTQSVLAAAGATPVLHWHGDAFDIPVGATRLAETPGYPNQAFSAGPNVLALQPHLEADVSQLERWLIGHAHELAHHRIDPAQLRHDANTNGPRLAQAANKVLSDWLDQLNPPTTSAKP